MCLVSQVGSVGGDAAPVSQVAWAAAASGSSSLLLATGAADGGVRLFSRSRAGLSKGEAWPAHEQAPGLGREQCMARLGTVLQPDLRAVTSLAFTSVAAGAEAGALQSPGYLMRRRLRLQHTAIEGGSVLDDSTTPAH